MEDLNELLKIIEEINDELYKLSSMHPDYLTYYGIGDDPIYLHTNGSYKYITFSEYSIWDSENDERQIINDDGEYEPLKLFLKRRINELAQVFSKIILKEE